MHGMQPKLATSFDEVLVSFCFDLFVCFVLFVFSLFAWFIFLLSVSFAFSSV